MTLKVIAYAHNGHTDKFGIPRQSREESPIVTRIVFEPEYAVREALRGIEGFSHLWILWGFNGIPENRDTGIPTHELSWSPTVRPPRLGGNKRVGVFATRSPFRPNPIGLSSVRLLKVIKNSKLKIQNESHSHLELLVSGADVLDGTPIYDIKPYLRYSDSHPDAVDGFAAEHSDYALDVRWDDVRCTKDLPEQVRRDIEYILSQDPRPAYQNDPEREYKMDYGGYTITFIVDGASVRVKKVQKAVK